MHEVRFPNESENYRQKRNELLEAEVALRSQIEEVAKLRRELPVGGEVQNYVFGSSEGDVSLSELFGEHETLILYSYMYGPNDDHGCPMCSAFMDSLQGQMKHVNQRAGFAVVARSGIDRISKLAETRGWQDMVWVSAAENDYPIDYTS